jgi:hypothetical protein
MMGHDLDLEDDIDASDSQAEDTQDNGEKIDQTNGELLETNDNSLQALESIDTAPEGKKEAVSEGEEQSSEVDLESLEIEEWEDAAPEAPEGKKETVSEGEEQSSEVDLESLEIEEWEDAAPEAPEGKKGAVSEGEEESSEVDLESLEIEEWEDAAPEGKKNAISEGEEESSEVDLESLEIEEKSSSKAAEDINTATETQEELEERRAEFQAMQKRIADASPGEKGSEFEEWANKWVFGDKRRVTIRPELNKHLEDADIDGLGIATRRTSDNYVGSDGAIWDAKAYSAGSKISEDQLREYSVMQEAGRVYDSQGNEIEVKSVNYLFSDKAAAEANASLLSYYSAIAWYTDDSGEVKPLESR